MVEEIKIKPLHVIYKSPNGFCILSCKDIKNGCEMIVKGYNLPDNYNTSFNISGTWQNDKKYGEQFVVTSYNQCVPSEKDEVINYLLSIKGVGKNTAEKIYNMFKSETMEVLENNSELLFNLNLPKNKITNIINEYQNDVKKTHAKYFLAKYLSPSEISDFISKYGNNSEYVFKANPYAAMHKNGLSFKKADELYLSFGNSPDSQERIKECIIHCVKINESSGSVYMEKMHMLQNVLHILKCNTINQYDVANAALSLIDEKRLIMVDHLLCTPECYNAEKTCAKEIFKLISKVTDGIICDVNAEIDMQQFTDKITFSPEQKNAIFSALKQKCLVITGGPGTGKTTIIKYITKIYQKYYNDDICFLAPTGRAARIISEVVNQPAYTINSVLELDEDNTNIHYKELPNKFTIVDEFSMVDIYTAASLFKSIQQGNRLLILGDIDQLPSIGPGCVLKDLIESGIIPVIRLEQLYRQENGNPISNNAKKIKRGCTDLFYNENFLLYNAYDYEQAADFMIKEYLNAISVYGVDNVFCVCPFKQKTASSAYNINAAIQKIINPDTGKQIHYKDTYFRINDRVMTLKNNHDKNVSNGDIGIIKEIFIGEKNKPACKVYINNHTVTYNYSELDELSLAYAMTIHKSQGMECACIITNIMNGHSKMLYRNLIYTAITRAKNKVVIIGQQSALLKSITVVALDNRITNLQNALKFLDYKRNFEIIKNISM